MSADQERRFAFAGGTGIEKPLDFGCGKGSSEELDFINAAQPGRITAEWRGGNLESVGVVQTPRIAGRVKCGGGSAIHVELAAIGQSAIDGHRDKMPLVVCRYDSRIAVIGEAA